MTARWHLSFTAKLVLRQLLLHRPERVEDIAKLPALEPLVVARMLDEAVADLVAAGALTESPTGKLEILAHARAA